MAAQQLYGPVNPEGGFENALNDLEERRLRAQSLNTEQGYKDAEFFQNTWNLEHQKYKDYKEELKEYHDQSLKKLLKKLKEPRFMKKIKMKINSAMDYVFFCKSLDSFLIFLFLKVIFKGCLGEEL